VALWQEFCRAFHGKAQVTWSTGRHDIRKRLGLKEKTDEEIAEQEEQEAKEKQLVAVVPRDFWDAFMRLRSNAGLRLLEAAEQGGTAAVDDVIRRLLVEVAKWERERERGRSLRAA
jgi:glutamine synthetase